MIQRGTLLFKGYYDRDRTHRGLDGAIPDSSAANRHTNVARLDNYLWKYCCRGLYQLPIAA